MRSLLGPHAAFALALLVAACSDGESPPASGGGSQGGASGSGGAAASGGAAPNGEVHLKVLFVGNSYTYVNDLPAVVAALDDVTPGVTLEIESVVKGGATLEEHWLSTGARARIEGGAFDRVVLQGQSVEPITQPEVFQSNAALLGQAARDAGGHAVWYATWARRAGDPWYGLEPISTPAEMTAALDAGYQMASGDAEPVAHAGRAWEAALTAQPELVLYAEDGSHPSATGTLLTALVMFRAVTGLTPELPTPPPLGVSADLAATLRDLALQESPCPIGTEWSDGACAGPQP